MLAAQRRFGRITMLGPHDHGEANGVIRGIVREKIMRFIVCTVLAALVLVFVPIARVQGKARTLVAVWAHADEEGPVAPILARYAREGVQVHMIIATDGAQGAANTSVPRRPEIAELRVEEARCSAQALGIHPPSPARLPRRRAWEASTKKHDYAAVMR